jgi:biopolymer transport protein ExbB
MDLDWVLKGGWVMLPLLLFSVLSLAVIIEKALGLASRQVISWRLVHALEEGKPLSDVILLLNKDDTVLGQFLRKISQKSHESKAMLEELTHSYFKKTWNDLEKRLETLNIVATTSPLLGLLGTVLGMVSIFQALSQSGSGNALVLSKGISEALITTITGLSIAVPAMIAYAYFSKKIEQYLLTFEECGKLFISQLKGSAAATTQRLESNYVG